MSSKQRIAITVTPDERAALRDLAHQRREPEATTAARLLRTALEHHGHTLDDPPASRRAPAPQTGSSAPPWLPPSRCEAAITALCSRYAIARPARLNRDRAFAERLAALAAWRQQLDTGTYTDPRMELAFNAELADLKRSLDPAHRFR